MKRYCGSPKCNKALPDGARPNQHYCDNRCRSAARYYNNRKKMLAEQAERQRRAVLKKLEKPVKCSRCPTLFVRTRSNQILCEDCRTNYVDLYVKQVKKKGLKKKVALS